MLDNIKMETFQVHVFRYLLFDSGDISIIIA